jgi:hypothetical protein
MELLAGLEPATSTYDRPSAADPVKHFSENQLSNTSSPGFDNLEAG